MLASMQLKNACGIPDYETPFPRYSHMTLNAPRLKYLKVWDCKYYLRLNIVHHKSVERLVTDYFEHFNVKQLKNLKYLQSIQEFSSKILPNLKRLKEIHLQDTEDVQPILDQKHQYGRTDLKVYLNGLLLNGLQDPAIADLSDEEVFRIWIADPARQADEIAYQYRLRYGAIETVSAEAAISIVSRYPDLNGVMVSRPVQDIQRFLNFLKHFDNIANLDFDCDQPQALFDQLPDHSAVQKLTITCALSDCGFLAKLKHLISLNVRCQVDIESVQKVLEELEFLKCFKFQYLNKKVEIEIKPSEQFQVSVIGKKTGKRVTVSEVDAVIQYILKTAK